MTLSRPKVKNAVFDRYWIEKVILKLGDKYHIRVQWDRTTAISTGMLAVVGALVGGYAGGKLWHAAVGAAVGGATGLALASLRDIWSMIRDKIEELIYIVYNYLRRIDPDNYKRAFDIIMACTASRRELVIIIVEFLTEKLARRVISSLTSA